MRSTVLVSSALLLHLSLASAHHSFAPVYDGSRTVTVAGTVTAFRLVNPHAQMSVDVSDDAGKVVTWVVEFDGRLNLTNAGWSDDTITVGERLSVTGNPTHTGSARLFFINLQRADGSLLQRPGVDRIQALEEQRRQRNEQRK
jgi:Family of unknown function (DUF6152)